jgi:quercetin dioxygenase-like cupin family protein
MTTQDGEVPRPRVLTDTAALAALPDAPSGALWKLAEPGRQLDANVVRLPPSARVAPHTEPDLDVLLLVLAGNGTLLSTGEPRGLRAGELTWLPYGAVRGIEAGPDGLTYLTVHRRRPGMSIRGPRDTRG